MCNGTEFIFQFCFCFRDLTKSMASFISFTEYEEDISFDADDPDFSNCNSTDNNGNRSCPLATRGKKYLFFI